MAARSWPPLPTTIHGMGGPITVRRPTKLEKGHEGLWVAHHRQILVQRSLPRRYAWMVLCHEFVHSMETDTGVQLPETDTVSMQDALGSLLMLSLEAYRGMAE